MRSDEEFYKQRINLDFKSFMKVERRRARRTAVTLGASTIISLIFLVFGFIQKTEAAKAKDKVELMRIELHEQATAAQTQMINASQNDSGCEEELAEQKRQVETQKELAVRNSQIAQQQKELAHQQREKSNEIIKTLKQQLKDCKGE
jgi:hypothetical protein